MDWIKRLSKQRKQDNITLIRKAVEDMVNSRLKRPNRDKEVSLWRNAQTRQGSFYWSIRKSCSFGVLHYL